MRSLATDDEFAVYRECLDALWQAAAPLDPQRAEALRRKVKAHLRTDSDASASDFTSNVLWLVAVAIDCCDAGKDVAPSRMYDATEEIWGYLDHAAGVPDGPDGLPTGGCLDDEFALQGNMLELIESGDATPGRVKALGHNAGKVRDACSKVAGARGWPLHSRDDAGAPG